MKQSGTTLLELVVVLAIAGILLAVGIPSFASLARSSRLSAATNEFLASLHLARSEAIKRGGRAVMCPSATGTSCADGGGWHQGWLLFHDGNNNARVDAGEDLVLARQALPAGLRLTGNATVSEYISYAPDGATRRVSGAFQAGTLTVCYQTASPVVANQVVISSTGRPRTARSTLASCP